MANIVHVVLHFNSRAERASMQCSRLSSLDRCFAAQFIQASDFAGGFLWQNCSFSCVLETSGASEIVDYDRANCK